MSDGNGHGQRRAHLEQLIREMPADAVDILQRLEPDLLRRLESGLTLDALTGLANRRSLTRTLWQARTSRVSGVVALLDLDHFKLVNDRLGHTAGDQLLVRFAERLRAAFPPACEVARTGGDEFVVFLPAATTEQAVLPLERLIADLGVTPLAAGDGRVTVSFSAGVVQFKDLGPDQVLKAADIAAYAAKARGRGRVEVFTDQVSQVLVRRRELAASVVELQRRLADLEGAVRTDALTGLHNFRALEEILDTRVGAATSQDDFVAVAFIDIDHFGDYNRLHEHHRGDAALRSVALALRESLRDGDLLFRKGGEEFVAILCAAGADSAESWAERMRVQVEALGIPHRGSTTAPHLTVTIGLATGGAGGTWRELMYAAGEQAMAAKRLRLRNRVHWQHLV